MNMNACIYVLKLYDGKYYCGTMNFQTYQKKGDAWLNLHKPQQLIQLFCCVNETSEKEKTLELMRLYGWQNVRGSIWTDPNMSSPPDEL